MRSWPALLLAPLVALTELSIVYSMVTPSCASQDRSGLHLVAAICVLIVLALTGMAWQAWRRVLQQPIHGHSFGGPTPYAVTAADGDSAQQRPNFVALMAVLVGALSLLVCGALWLPIWILSPCY